MPDVTAEFARQRLAHLESLATELAARGLASRMLGTGAPVLWVWHPRSGRQTIVFAGPAADGWLFLWSPGGQGRAEEPVHVADLLGKLLDGTPRNASDG
ncbi:hypothetical protein OHA77_10365 [Streptosporangium sp. NBC_01639]|uniref:hypothetical protein n=1 Tax=unclassified Streptosporangium TaxID=2632669 RepID=UPI002DD8972C|nr:hypothetical protein [Streptosporangium sp. NBC_01756]WSC84462.1 hypothetical protein OIE48_29305 [Streptosporangium sp. NBC_01756]WTD56906.1 hypothetical protein OHA77_10365 [Streptosporangium sp. NBC_01639]